MKSASQELLNITSVGKDAGYARGSIAIASPCSTCKNFRSQADDQHPGCPRRYWSERKAELEKTDDGTPAPPEYLTAAGGTNYRRLAADVLSLNGSDIKPSSGFRNPVELESSGTRMVWVATLEENQMIFSADGSVRNFDILDGTMAAGSSRFDTDFITCRPTPYIPMMSESRYLSGEQVREGDWLFLHSLRIPQIDRNSPETGDAVQIGGFCQKITPMQKFVIKPAPKSVNGKTG